MCLTQSKYSVCVCVSVCFLFSWRVKIKEAGDRRREKVDHVEKKGGKKSSRDERSGEEGCFILYCEGLLLINVSWSVSVGAE